MTPRVQQAIEMLQYSNLELSYFIDREIQNNPLLERRERRHQEDPPEGDVGNGARARSRAVPEILTGELTPNTAEYWQPEWGEAGDRSIDVGGEPQPWDSRYRGCDDDVLSRLDHTASHPRTLREHLLEQIGADLYDQGDRVIAVHLLDLLDEDGYLRVPLDREAQFLGVV
jgi:RNA polymerase sigma-54 factor